MALRADAFGRKTAGYATVTNAFLYNASGEVTNAVLRADNYDYSYDAIGNRVWSAVNTLTNSYTANALNQYTLISNPVNPVNPVQISNLVNPVNPV